MPYRKNSWRIPVLFVVLGAVWVVGTRYGLPFVPAFLGPNTQETLRLAAGLCFVGIAAGFMFVLQHRYAQRLDSSATYYHSLYTESPCGLILVNSVTGQIIEANNAALTAFTGTLAQIQKQHLEALFEPTVGQKLAMLFDVQPGAFKQCGIWKINRAQPAEFFVDLYTSRIQIDDQELLLLGFINATPTITAQREASSYADQLFEMQEKISDAYIVLDKTYHVKRVNQAFLSMLGVNREYMLGNVIWDLFPDSTKTKFYTNYQEVLSNGVSIHFEDYYPHLNQWYRVSAYPTPEGLVAYARDISREKRDVARLEESERNLNAVLLNTTDAIWYLDRDLALVFANPAYKNIRKQVVGLHTDEGFSVATDANTNHLEFIETLQLAYKKALAGQQVNIQLSMQYKNGKVATLEGLINPVLNAAGSVQGLGCFARDVTDKIRAENQIRLKNERLRNIAWYQSHLVRGPVASLLGLVRIFDFKNPAEATNIEVLQHVRTMAERLDAAVRSIVQETDDTA